MSIQYQREPLISRVIGSAAESLSLEEVGRDVLPHLERLLGSSKLLFYISNAEQPFFPIAGADDCLPEYISEFAQHDPIQHFLQRENPALLAGTRCSAWSEVRKHRGLSEFYDRWDLSWFFHIRLSETCHMQPGYAAIAFGRAAKQRDFSEMDLRSAASVLPALNAAVRRAGRLSARLSSAEAVEALFEREQGRAVLAVDLQGKLLWISSQAERLLGARLRTEGEILDGFDKVVRHLGVIARGEGPSLHAPTPYCFKYFGENGEIIEAEAYLQRKSSGELFIAVDLGGAGMSPALLEIARDRGLTRSETEVLAGLIQGHADAEIASRRFVSVATVRTHVTRVLSKFGVRSRLQAVAFALGTHPPKQY